MGDEIQRWTPKTYWPGNNPDDVQALLHRDPSGQWVARVDHVDALSSLRAENERLRGRVEKMAADVDRCVHAYRDPSSSFESAKLETYTDIQTRLRSLLSVPGSEAPSPSPDAVTVGLPELTLDEITALINLVDQQDGDMLEPGQSVILTYEVLPRLRSALASPAPDFEGGEQ